MKMMKLGRTDLEVSELCLGTMTWGRQNTTAEGHEQIDYALERGVNFMDTAEMYPVAPVLPETVGDTEKVIGEWIEKTGKRDQWVIASKVSGLNDRFVRQGIPLSGATMKESLEGSLKRLKTDYIDLYQIHWPNRGSYAFRQNWAYDSTKQVKDDTLDHMRDVLAAMTEIQKSGKVRHFGLSNESAWGVTQWNRLADEMGAPRMQTIQNEYSLLYREFDTDLAETCNNEDVTLLAYSPLATGLLTDKYKGGTVVPEGSRRAQPGSDSLGNRVTDRAFIAVEEYKKVAEKHGIDLVQMSIAFCTHRPFGCSPIFGATTMDQLKLALDADDLVLNDDVLADIAAVHRAHPQPF